MHTGVGRGILVVERRIRVARQADLRAGATAQVEVVTHQQTQRRRGMGVGDEVRHGHPARGETDRALDPVVLPRGLDLPTCRGCRDHDLPGRLAGSVRPGGGGQAVQPGIGVGEGTGEGPLAAAGLEDEAAAGQDAAAVGRRSGARFAAVQPGAAADYSGHGRAGHGLGADQESAEDEVATALGEDAAVAHGTDDLEAVLGGRVAEIGDVEDELVGVPDVEGLLPGAHEIRGVDQAPVPVGTPGRRQVGAHG